jgi:hypothetical protein
MVIGHFSMGAQLANHDAGVPDASCSFINNPFKHLENHKELGNAN